MLLVYSPLSDLQIVDPLLHRLHITTLFPSLSHQFQHRPKTFPGYCFMKASKPSSEQSAASFLMLPNTSLSYASPTTFR